jgi:Xaa-Pro aminopeptidase
MPIAERTERTQELRRRRDEIAGALGERGQDALLFTREGNVGYLCGYWTSTWSNFSRPVFGLLAADGRVAFVTAETEVDAVRERVPDVEVHGYVELRPVADSTHLPDGRVQFGPQAGDVLGRLLRAWGVERLMVDGLDAAFPPVAQLTHLLPAGTAALADASALLWGKRLIKSEWEIARLRESCDVLAAGFAAFEREVAPGLSERELHGVLAAAIMRNGADVLGYTNVFAGVERGLFGAPTDRTWQAGEVLYVDGGAIVDGYWADFCRMYVADTPTEPQARGYGRAVTSLEAATDAFHGEMTAGDLARTIATASGLRPEAVGFGRFGHGIGLYMPEPPSLHPLDDTPLAAGSVVCVEPAVEHEGANYVAEEQCVVRDGRLELLSPPAPRALIQVA